MAQTLSQALRVNDLVARYGGEEFVALLPGCGAPCAVRKAEDIRQRIEAQVRTPDGPVTVSVGIAVIEPTSDESIEQAFRRADAALYQAKRAGRNCVRLASG